MSLATVTSIPFSFKSLGNVISPLILEFGENFIIGSSSSTSPAALIPTFEFLPILSKTSCVSFSFKKFPL